MSNSSPQSRLRRGSPRLSNYDYAQGGWYHLVASTADRHHSFGTVQDGIVGLSKAGCIAAWAWRKTVSVYDRAVLDEFIIMPDHVHLLLGLRSRRRLNRTSPPEATEGAAKGTTGADKTDPGGRSHRQSNAAEDDCKRSFGEGLIPHSVSSIMNHYKGRVTKTIRRYDACPGFAWQPRFYDRIIRSRDALDAHRRYIATNPTRWKEEGPPPDQLLPR